jgi:hypothetical protein
MDLIVGHTGKGSHPTCVFAADYNETIMSKRSWSHVSGDDIQVLAVFLNKGDQLDEVHQNLATRSPSRFIGWFKASPGEITDEVHYIFAPDSIANTFSRSVDLIVDPEPKKSHGQATRKPDGDVSGAAAEPGQSRRPPRQSAEPKPRAPRKPKQLVEQE